MTYKQQLTELFCTVPEIDKQIKELKIGTKVILKDYFWEKILLWSSLINIMVDEPFNIKIDKYNWLEEIIWNPIEYHHLMMYCRNNNILYSFNNKQWFDIIELKNENDLIDIPLDNTKLFNEQSEEVYENIFNFLNK